MSGMKIETLTEGERELLSRGGGGKVLVEAKALHIIDQLTATLEAAEHDHHEQRESRKYWEQQHGVAWDRAEALQAHVAELEARIERQRAANRGMQRSLDERDSELADLRGQVERAKEALVSAPVSLDGRIARALEALRGR